MDLRRYRSNATGSITISFAIVSLALTVAAGCAVDYLRWSKVRTELQALTDAAALSAAASTSTTSKDMRVIADRFLSANKELVSIRDVTTDLFSYDTTSQKLTVRLKGQVPMAFMGIVGVDHMEVKARSTVKSRGSPPVEAVLVLDTTYSMVGSKIDTLQMAAKRLAKSILWNNQARVGIVPFSSYVNIGVSRRNEPGISVPADSSTKTESCSTSYPNAKNCSTKTTTSTCTSNNDGLKSTYSCSSSSTTCESWGDPVKTCKSATSTSKFRGCVGSRAEAYRLVINAIENTYPGLMNTNCSPEILDLESSIGKVVSTIETLKVSGETYLPGGITWGWNMLTPEAPLTSALTKAALKAKGGKKVMVIMTDGTNTLAPTTTGAGTHGGATSGPYKNTAYGNTLTAQLCQNIKADDIEVYTVLFDVDDAVIHKLLQDCASGISKSYVAKNADELVAAFDGIAKQLAQVKIVN